RSSPAPAHSGPDGPGTRFRNDAWVVLSGIGRQGRPGKLPGDRARTRWSKGLPAAQAAGSRALWRINGLRASRAAGFVPGDAAPAAADQAARSASVVKLSPQPHSAAALGLANTNSWFRPLRTKSIVVPSTIGWLVAST